MLPATPGPPGGAKTSVAPGMGVARESVPPPRPKRQMLTSSDIVVVIVIVLIIVKDKPFIVEFGDVSSKIWTSSRTRVLFLGNKSRVRLDVHIFDETSSVLCKLATALELMRSKSSASYIVSGPSGLLACPWKT